MGKIDQGRVPLEQGAIRQLEQLPFMEIGGLITYASIDTETSVPTIVDVNKIVSAPNANNWTLNNPRSVGELSRAILIEEVVLANMEPPQLFEIDGLYGVLHDGRHRVAAMKLINLDYPSQTIQAEVSKVRPFKEVFAFTEDEYQELLKRKELGLWQGNISGGQNNSVPTGFYASGKVDSYVGSWVFSRDVEKAKALFEVCQKH